MALVFFACWIVWALQEAGLRGVATMAIPSESIDEARVKEARARAQARLREKISDEEIASLNASLVRSLAQLQIKRRRRR